MKLNFKYDIEKDIENFIKSSKSVNSKKLTKAMEEYVDKYGQVFESDNLREFINEKLGNIDLEKVLTEITDNWLKIESEFISRSEKIFGCTYPIEEVTVYLTLNSRCTYNTAEKYFFVSIPRADISNSIIMHELFHFYTKEVFGGVIHPEKYNEIKEALTVILNIEYADLMGDHKDEGYSQHGGIRQKVLDLWSEGKNLKEVVTILGN